MANDYLTFEEACETLGKSVDEVNGLIASGQLSEVRDGGQVFYKRTEVEQIAAKEGSSIVDLAAEEDVTAEQGGTDEAESFASALSSLADSSSGLDLLDEGPVDPAAAEGGVAEAVAEPLEADAGGQIDTGGASPMELSVEDFPEDLPAAPKEPGEEDTIEAEEPSEIELLPAEEAPAVEATAEEATAEVPDLGLSGSSLLGLAASVEEGEAESDRAALASGLEVPDLGLSGSSILSMEAGTEEATPSAGPSAEEAAPTDKPKGISVFDEEDLAIEADPMGETQITSSVEDFDSVGSGSGLLDLTRESDDTSLGPELEDVISPTEAEETETEGVAIAAETLDDGAAMGVAAAEVEMAGPTVAARAPRAAAGSMAGSVPMTVCAFLGIACLALLGLTTAAAVQGVWPGFLNQLASGVVHYAVFGGLALVAIVTGVLGILAGR
jgi:excisionase family DNA binding protein